jgi:guanine nucleotide-binding protein G(i) subunit alpha
MQCILTKSIYIGKNTLYKQFCKETKEFTERDLHFFKNEVYVNLILTVARVYEHMEKLGESFHEQSHNELAKKLSNLSITMTSVNLNYTMELHEKILDLIDNSSFKRKLTDYFYVAHCPEGIQYFINKKEELNPDTFTPDFEDILRIRRKTSGIVTNQIEYKGYGVQFTVLTGQQCERKKWNPLLKREHIMIFVVSLSDYDQTLYEDETMNRQKDALDLFEQFVSKEQFLGRMVFLVMNKADLFKAKYSKSNPAKCFSDFSYEKYPTPEDGIKFIEAQYEARFLNKRTDRQNLFIYQTSGLDEDSQFIFERIFTEVVYEPSMAPSPSVGAGSPSKRNVTPRAISFSPF